MEIYKGQIWASKNDFNYQVEIAQRRGGRRWKVKKLTDRTGMYNGTHTLNQRTLLSAFRLLA